MYFTAPRCWAAFSKSTGDTTIATIVWFCACAPFGVVLAAVLQILNNNHLANWENDNVVETLMADFDLWLWFWHFKTRIKMSTGSINIDKAFKNVVGEFGHRQKLYCLFLSLTNCYYAFQVSQLTYWRLMSICCRLLLSTLTHVISDAPVQICSAGSSVLHLLLVKWHCCFAYSMRPRMCQSELPWGFGLTQRHYGMGPGVQSGLAGSFNHVRLHDRGHARGGGPWSTIRQVQFQNIQQSARILRMK